jgi:hypothetical protein
MFEAYFDVSGSPGATEVLTLAGLVATRSRWEHLMMVWERAMARGGAKDKILHMRELAHSQKQYANWTEEAKINLLRKLFPILRTHVTYGVCVSIPIDAFDVTVGSKEMWDVRLPGASISLPHNFLLQLCMWFILKSIPSLSVARPVTFVFEQDAPRDPDTMREFYHRREAIGGPGIFREIRFSPKGPAPLQAADLIAYANHQIAIDQCTARGERQTKLRRFLREQIDALRSVIEDHFKPTPPQFVFGVYGAERLAWYRDALNQAVRKDPTLVDKSVETFIAAQVKMLKRRAATHGGK